MEIANIFLLSRSCVYLSYGFGPIQGEPFAWRAALAAPTYIRPDVIRSKVPHARCEGAGSKGMGPFCTAASFSQVEIRSHIHLGSHELLLSVHSLPLEDGASRHQARFKIAP